MLLFLVGVAAGIFFLIPGIPHIIADSAMHVKHAIAAFALGVLGILASIESPKIARIVKRCFRLIESALFAPGANTHGFRQAKSAPAKPNAEEGRT